MIMLAQQLLTDQDALKVGIALFVLVIAIPAVLVLMFTGRR